MKTVMVVISLITAKEKLSGYATVQNIGFCVFVKVIFILLVVNYAGE